MTADNPDSNLLCRPQPKRRQLRDPFEVRIRRQHQELVLNAHLSKQCVNGAHLYALPPAGVSQLGRVNVVLPVRYDKGECRKPLHDSIPSFRACETLKQFLEDQARCEDRLACLERMFEQTHLEVRWWSIPS